jgi:hypothetical protein
MPLIGVALKVGGKLLKVVGKTKAIQNVKKWAGSKIKNIFKKKGGGTTLGNSLKNVVNTTKAAAVEAAGAEVGAITHGIASNLGSEAGNMSNDTEFGKGFKEGFFGAFFQKNKVLVLGIGAGVIGLIIFLVTRKKR